MDNRDTKRNYVLDMIIKNLDNVSESLEELSKFTNGEVVVIKLELAKLIEDVKSLKERSCPRDPAAMRELIEVERIKYAAKQPKERRELILWLVTIVSSVVALYFAFRNEL